VQFLFLRRLGLGVPAALIGAGFLGFSRLFWGQSNRVEVYSLHMLLGISACLFALRWRDTGKLRELQLACLFVGLGLVHHLTIVLWLPGLLVLAGKRVWTDPNLGKRLLACIPIFFLGPLLYLCLPLWARDETRHNWGDPSSVQNLWNHISARLYQGQMGLPTVRSFPATGQAALQALPLYFWPFVLIGAGFLWKKQRVGLVGLGLIALVTGVHALCYSISDISAYYLPALLLVCAALGALIEPLPAPRVKWALALAAPLCLGTINLNACNLHDATFVREFARHKLQSCSQNAVLIVEGDQDVFPTFYVNEALGVRTDVLPIARGMVAMDFRSGWSPKYWYTRSLRARGVALTLPPDSLNFKERMQLGEDGYFLSLLDGPLAHRPIHTTFLAVSQESAQSIQRLDLYIDWIKKSYNPTPQGLVIALYPKSATPTMHQLAERGQGIWDGIALPAMRGLDLTQEMSPTYLRQHYVTMLLNQGNLWEMSGEPGNALQLYQLLADWEPSTRESLKQHSQLARSALNQTP
jgi:hypothetical protein